MNNHTRIAQYLIENGSDINAKNRKSRTALHLAAEQSYYQLAQLLTKYGADISIKDQDGKQAIDLIGVEAQGLIRFLVQAHEASHSYFIQRLDVNQYDGTDKFSNLLYESFAPVYDTPKKNSCKMM